MQGRKLDERKLFYTVSLDELVPNDHPVRRLSEVLDLAFLYDETRPYYSHEGKPSVDPVVLFKLYILGYFFGISSERRFCQEVRVNLAYRRYLGYDLDEAVPNHSVLSKARVRFSQSVFSGLFIRILDLCKQRGLISGQIHFVDSSLIRANASKDSFRENLPKPEDYLAELQSETSEVRAKPHSYAFEGTVNPEKMGKRRDKPRKNDRFRSRTDPDAQIVTRPGKGTFPAYKAQFCVDRRKRVVLSVGGTVATDDDMSSIDTLFTAAWLASGRFPATVVADKHYGGIEGLKYYQDQGVETCIHPRIADNTCGKLKNTDFEYSPNERTCRCPAGKLAVKRVRHRYRDQFRFAGADCAQCKLKAKCTNAPGGRLVSFYRGGYFNRAGTLASSTRGGEKLLRARQIIVEGVIGEAKSWHGLSRCRYRGLPRFEMQLLLTASVINLKRLLESPRPPALSKRRAKPRSIVLANRWNAILN